MNLEGWSASDVRGRNDIAEGNMIVGRWVGKVDGDARFYMMWEDYRRKSQYC